MNFLQWLCGHPAKHLALEKPVTVEPIDADFERHRVTLRCLYCGALIERSGAVFVGGVAAFMERGRRGRNG